MNLGGLHRIKGPLISAQELWNKGNDAGMWLQGLPEPAKRSRWQHNASNNPIWHERSFEYIMEATLWEAADKE